MAIYVDDLKEYTLAETKAAARGLGCQWCHLTADTREELHEFAARLGLKRAWFQDHNWAWHYDLTPRMRARAIRMGALARTGRELAVEVYRLRRRGTTADGLDGARTDVEGSHGADGRVQADERTVRDPD